MGSDRARVSYDPRQQYRSVVMQQGRVTLEADFNEELAIAGDALREETLDIVGPNGTPDNGYLIEPLSSPPFDFGIALGTMYVGGLRVATPARIPPPPPPPPPPPAVTASTARAANPSFTSAAKVVAESVLGAHVGEFSPGAKILFPFFRYSQQTDWLDHSDDPDWVDISSGDIAADEFVYLFLREQEVSAVEDSDLKDVALGGPDTAQRTRLIQHVVRLSITDITCVAGLLAARKRWKSEGLGFNAKTMRLEPTATLMVSLSSSVSKPDPCNPQAQGGYLGADNQLIRVQISGTDQATGNPKFVWGFDDASFLYRLDLDANNKQLLHLQSRPVDAAHQPRANQAVEVLRSAAELANREYVASLSGVVLVLNKPYDPDTQMISLPAPMTKLPDEFYDSKQTPRVFLRVWEQEVVFTPGTAMDLGDTGLQVTLQAPGNVFHTGDYWLFAVRPSTPQQVYPERYLEDFQSPDGPRMWACPLGVITWNKEEGMLAEDCRNPFDNLVELTKRKQGTGCCTVSVRPKDLTGKTTLQSIVDSLIRPAMVLTAADAGTAGNDIEFAVTKVFPDPDPLQTSFNIALLDRHTYSGLTTATIQSVLAASPGLVQASGQVPAGIPPQAASLYLSAGTASVKASAQFATAQGTIAFTLTAKKVGVAGNNTYVSVTNVNFSSGTFDLNVEYRVNVPSISLDQLVNSVDEFLAYDISISPPAGGALLAPPTGITHLSGGADGANPVKASATLFAALQSRICFAPGIYALPGTLVLDRRHSGLTLEGCSGEVVLAAAVGSESKFLQGLVLVVGASDVSLSGLTFMLPAVGFIKAGGLLADIAVNTLAALGVPDVLFLKTAVGVRAVDCINLAIEECVFEFQTEEELIFEAGILASGKNTGLMLTDNIFRHVGTAGTGQVLYGYVLSPHLSQVEFDPSGIDKNLLFENALALPCSLAEATISGNIFSRLSGAAVIYAGIGSLSIESNRAEACRAGFMLFNLKAAFSNESQFLEVILDTSFIFGTTIATGFPLPNGTDLTSQIQVGTQTNLTSFGSGAYEQLVRLAEVFVAADMAAFFQAVLVRPSTVLVSHNEVDTGGSGAGPAFVLWGDDTDARAGIVLNGNTMRGSPVASVFEGQIPVPLAAIFDVAWGSVTGNVILNELNTNYKISLAIGPLQSGSFVAGFSAAAAKGFETKAVNPQPFAAAGPQGIASAGLPVNKATGVAGAAATTTGNVAAAGATGATGPPPPIDTHIAVTGNTLRGFPVLPPHGLPAPFDRWEPLNLIIPA